MFRQDRLQPPQLPSILKLHIGLTEQFSCRTGSQTTEHLLQSCTLYKPLRKWIWTDHTPIADKLYSNLEDLRCTANSIEQTGVSVKQTRRKRKRTCWSQNAEVQINFQGNQERNKNWQNSKKYVEKKVKNKELTAKHERSGISRNKNPAL